MSKAEVFGPGTYDSCAKRVKKLTGLLLVFHPGCGHCVQMRPEWEAMKRKLSPKVNVMEIDGSEMAEHDGLKANLPEIQGFPMLFLMKNGRRMDEFKGQRTADEMQHFTENGLGIKKLVKRKTNRKKTRRKTQKKKR